MTTNLSTWDVASIDVDWLNAALSSRFSKEIIKFTASPLTEIVSLGCLHRITLQ